MRFEATRNYELFATAEGGENIEKEAAFGRKAVLPLLKSYLFAGHSCANQIECRRRLTEACGANLLLRLNNNCRSVIHPAVSKAMALSLIHI